MNVRISQGDSETKFVIGMTKKEGTPEKARKRTKGKKGRGRYRIGKKGRRWKETSRNGGALNERMDPNILEDRYADE